MSYLREEPFSLPTPDGKMIYGVLTHSSTPSDKIIILAHGFTGWMHDHILMAAKDFFGANGYNVARFNFYGMEENARLLHETTVKLQADDLNAVCNHFKPSYKKLYVAGHSYGGQTLLLANPKANAISFWDSSYTPYEGFFKEECHKLEGTPYYVATYGNHCLVGADMYEESKALDKKADSYAKKITTPSQVILAGESYENPVRTALYDKLACNKSLEDIEGADHCFTTKDTLDILLKTTLRWFDKHS